VKQNLSLLAALRDKGLIIKRYMNSSVYSTALRPMQRCLIFVVFPDRANTVKWWCNSCTFICCSYKIAVNWLHVAMLKMKRALVGSRWNKYM